MADVLCKVVNKEGTSGTVHATLPVNLENARRVGGGGQPGRATFTVSPFEPGLAQLKKEHLGGVREVQLWDADGCRWWGVPLDVELVDRRSLRYHCVDLKYHPQRRFFGPIVNNYWSPNADFEAGLANWTAVGCTATPDPAWKALGSQSVRLEQATAGVDTYLRRRHTTTTTTDPVFFAAKAMLRVDAAAWNGPALEERGLYLELQQPAGTFYPAVAPEWASITEGTERDGYIPLLLETGITVPAGGTFTIEGRLMAVGKCWWDHTALQTEESVGSARSGDLVEVIITRVAQYMQDPTQGKSDLSMPVVVVGPAGPIDVRIFQFYAGGNILAALSEFVERALVDWDVTWPLDGSSRSLTVWTAGRGAPSGATLTFPGNVVGQPRWSASGSDVVTKARRTGRGSKATMDVFEAVDTSQMGGLTLERVDSAPQDTPPAGLYQLAAADVAKHRAPVERTEYRLPAGEVWGVFDVGDTLTVTNDYGPVIQGTAARRVHHLDWDGDSVLVGWEDDV